MGRELERCRVGAEFRRGLPDVVRVAEVDPKAERLVLRFAVKELRRLRHRLRVAAGLHIVETLPEGPQPVLFQQLAHGSVVLRTVEVVAPAADADEISGIALQQFGKRGFIAGER